MKTTDYAKKLLEEKESLTSELSKLGRLNTENGEWEASPEEFDQSEADSNGQADRFEDFEEKSALIKPLEAKLAQINSAIKKIESDEFGICRVCKGPIEEGRLHANPSAETCITHREN